ncbi:MAG: amidohydrolase [Methanobacterium formicicum]
MNKKTMNGEKINVDGVNEEKNNGKGINENKPNIGFLNGNIITMDPEIENAEAIIIQNDRIVDVGSKGILESYPHLELIDLKGQTLMPSFIDAHHHLSFGCLLQKGANLRGILEKDDVLQKIKNYVLDHPGTGWVTAYPWMDVHQGGSEITREDLDSLNIDRPVLLIHHSFHKSVANSLALELAGINSATEDPRCGMIVRNEEQNPTGLLIECAQIPLFKLSMESKNENNPENYADLIEKHASELLPFGITAIQDPGVTPTAEAAYRILANEGRLPVSVLMMPHGEAMLDNQEINFFDGPVTGTGDEWLRVGPVKLFADGGVAGSMAFSGKIEGRVCKFGEERDDFEDKLIEATKRGFRVCVHSIGNAATEATLDSFEKAASVARENFEIRPRLEHLFLLSEDQIKRLSAMGGCSAVQACFLEGSQGLKEIQFEGLNWFRFKDMTKEGVILAGSSDAPGGFMDGRDPLKSAVMGSKMSDNTGNILFPDQALSFEKWLWMYTAGAAYAGGLENERGMLKKGLIADMVILEGDLNPEEPLSVVETWKNGKKVYKKEIVFSKNKN